MSAKFEEIPVDQSVLYQRYYHSSEGVQAHIRDTIVDPFDSIALMKFRAHDIDVEAVAANLNVIDAIHRYLVDDLNLKDDPQPALVRVERGDWLIEFLTVVATGTGVVAVVLAIVQGVQLKRIEREIRAVPRLVGDQVQMGQQVNSRQVIVSKLRGYSVQKIHDHLRGEMEFIELYHKDGRVERYTVESEETKNKAT